MKKHRPPVYSEEHQCLLVPLTQGKFALIDEEDRHHVDNQVWSACRYKNLWYAIARIRTDGKYRHAKLHRDIASPPKGFIVDHINGNGLDNRRSNLRVCTQRENMHNTTRWRVNNTSGFIGVHWSKKAKKWCAQVRMGGRAIWLGEFDDPVEAAKVRDVAVIKMHGPFAPLNFPEGW